MFAAPSLSILVTWFIYSFMVSSSQFAIVFLQIVPLMEGEQYVLVRKPKVVGVYTHATKKKLT
jgi:hypothetical protein